MLPLTELEQKRVEDNMGLVGKVIKDCLKSPGALGSFTYDDIYQIGCIGLCKAVQTDEGHRGAFSTYAYILIRNEIYNALAAATRHQRVVSSDQVEYLTIPYQEEYDQHLHCQELLQLLEQAEAAASGVTAKGIQALRMTLDGYSCKEIGARYHTTPNNITAWMSKGRKFLSSYAQSCIGA